KNYVPLAQGATFAEAFAGDDDESPEALQGDPFITMRPTPTGEWPKLAIDGKRYHGVNAVANIQFPDTDVNTTVKKTVVLSNRGLAPLKVRAGVGPTFIGPDILGQDGVTPQMGGVGMSLDAPARMRPGGVGSGMMFDEYVLKPGESLPV